MGLAGQPESLCGIGINFRADRTGALLVSSLIDGGCFFFSFDLAFVFYFFPPSSSLVLFMEVFAFFPFPPLFFCCLFCFPPRLFSH